MKDSIPQDDVLDVYEMSVKLEECIDNILTENKMELGLSALMSATINCMILQCSSVEQVIGLRNAFFHAFDRSIKSLKIN